MSDGLRDFIDRIPPFVTLLMFCASVFALGIATAGWSGLPGRVDRLEAYVAYNTCRGAMLDAGQSPEGCLYVLPPETRREIQDMIRRASEEADNGGVDL